MWSRVLVGIKVPVGSGVARFRVSVRFWIGVCVGSYWGSGLGKCGEGGS